MADMRAQGASNEFSLTAQEVAQLVNAVRLDDDDIKRVQTIRGVIEANIDRLADGFFEFLGTFPEAAPLLKNPALLGAARRLKVEHLQAMAAGDYGATYAEQRIKLGQIYGQAGLDIRIFLAACYNLVKSIGTAAAEQGALDPAETFQVFLSLLKVEFLDISIFLDAMLSVRERTISAQQDAIRELSTPVLRVRDHLLILPIIGIIDTHRARQLTDSLLLSIRENRAKVAVMDVTGVAAVDSRVANHLIQTIAAARLMGTIVIVTGLSADVAQALVTLGVDLRALNTLGDLQGGLELAERILDYKDDTVLLAR